MVQQFGVLGYHHSQLLAGISTFEVLGQFPGVIVALKSQLFHENVTLSC
jgi:hypothetical protein